MDKSAKPHNHSPCPAGQEQVELGQIMEADYVIVGGGSAGCVLANRLSENPDHHVILIEAGGNDINPLIHVPAGYIKTMVNPAMNWMFKNEATAGVHGRRIDMPRGKVLGGSSAINAMLYVRGQAADYNLWAQRGNPGWSYEDVLPYFKKAEHADANDSSVWRGTDQALSADYHGRGGPLNVSDIRSTYPILDQFADAAEQCGFPRNTDFNGASQEGFGYYQVTQKNGLRFSAKKAYINPVRHRKNLTIVTHAHVTRLSFARGSKHVTGVVCRRGGQDLLIAARREVVLSAGAIQSPQILELSGIGRPELLQQHGIAVQHELSGVGENFSDHYISRLSWRLRRNVSLNNRAHGLRLAAEIARYMLTRRGLLSLPAGVLGGFVKSDPALSEPDIQYHIAHASFENPAKRQFHNFPGFTIGPCQLRPESKGYVHITSADPFEAPAIQPNYLDAEQDQQVHIAGMRIARDIMNSPLMRDEVVEETKPGAELDSDDALLDYARQTGVTLYHPVSTCRMGPDPDRGDVVDARLRVHGLTGVRVADASIMPELVSGNTNAPTIMIGEKAADLIKQEA